MFIFVWQDAPISIIQGATKRIEKDWEQLILLDEFSIPFLYQALQMLMIANSFLVMHRLV